MSAKVAFLSRPLRDDEQAPFLGIPVSAIRQSSSEKHLFRIEGNRVRKTPVTIKRQWGDTAEVIDGLKDGDLVVLQPSAGLKDRGKVKVKE